MSEQDPTQYRHSLSSRVIKYLAPVAVAGLLGGVAYKEHQDSRYPGQSVPAEWEVDAALPEIGQELPEIDLEHLDELSPEVKQKVAENTVRINWEDSEGLGHQASGFYIGGNTVLTAGHVVQSATEQSGQNGIMLTGNDRSIQANGTDFMYRGEPNEEEQLTSVDIGLIKFPTHTDFGRAMKDAGGLSPANRIETGQQLWALNYQDGNENLQTLPLIVAAQATDTGSGIDNYHQRMLMTGIDGGSQDFLLTGGSGGVVINAEGEVAGISIKGTDAPLYSPREIPDYFGISVIGEPKNGWPTVPGISASGPSVAVMEVVPEGMIDSLLIR